MKRDYLRFGSNGVFAGTRGSVSTRSGKRRRPHADLRDELGFLDLHLLRSDETLLVLANVDILLCQVDDLKRIALSAYDHSRALARTIGDSPACS